MAATKATTTATTAVPQLTISDALAQMITKPIIVFVKLLTLIENEEDNLGEEQALRLDIVKDKREVRRKLSRK